MSAEENWSDSPGRPGSGGAVVRHPNGSINIGVYAAIAHRQRAAAISTAIPSAIRLMREAWAAVMARRSLQHAAAEKRFV